MPYSLYNKQAKFGTFEVFVTSISTILGAILFLRFGWAIGNVGFWNTILIIILGHLVALPTAFAIAEIATNQRVLGGGAYYIISRSFGFNIGGTVGITLYLSQAISVAFYVIAFAGAFEPVINTVNNYIGPKFGRLIPLDHRIISLPAMVALSAIALVRGANMGMKALYVVAGIIFLSLFLFFIGTPETAPEKVDFISSINDPKSFFYVFAVLFPAFTGLAAGLGLSGDLKNPGRAIPAGTILATAIGLVIYVGVTYKLIISASIENMAGNYLIMQKIAYWGPIIPIGLAAATVSSAIGSILVAPRTLQAIGVDSIFPNNFVNRWFGKGKPANNEPVNATLITVIIAFVFASIGELDLVARIISMFFMITYGAICLISLLEHFAADPSYRPKFRTHWIVSFIGTVVSFWLMFKMNTPIALLSLIILASIYFFITASKEETGGFGKLFRGVIFQLSRQLQIFVQRFDKGEQEKSWRPFVICISSDTFKRRSAFDLQRWLSFKYGFGTYIHFIEGYLSKQTRTESQKILDRLIKLASGSKNRVYLDTIISPSYTSAIAQVIQLSGISGRGNNMILFEFSRSEPETLKRSLDNYALIISTGFDICVLNTSYKGFGDKREIHIWITSYDYENANLMILLGYIILGHPEWRKGHIKIFALFKESEIKEKRENLFSLIKSGRLPISTKNIELIPTDETIHAKELISKKSVDADLTIVGFRHEFVKIKGLELFTGFNDVGNILFVSSQREKEIT
jgi:solute carrier family 12 sodium/potassium/chloride transporter 2